MAASQALSGLMNTLLAAEAPSVAVFPPWVSLHSK